MIPFADFFFSCGKTELVTIKIFEKFDNEDFGLKSIDFMVPNEALQFKTATVRVNTALFGIRYFMSEWFFTCALLCISAMTFGMSFFLILVIILAKKLDILCKFCA